MAIRILILIANKSLNDLSIHYSINPVVPAAILQPLKGAHVLFIVCALLFLTLLLLGLGTSYYCLRRRVVPVVRRLPMSLGSGSEITKLSGSSLPSIQHFEGLKIPRAHAPLAAVHSSSSDDNQLIPSDYPSESQSEVEVDMTSLPASSAGSYDNRAYMHDRGSSIYSEHYGHTQELQAANATAITSVVARHPMALREPSPQFDVQVRVKRAAPQPPSSSSDTDSVATSVVERNNLSTIMESHEDRESVMTMDSLPRDVAHSHFTYVPELHAAPQYQSPPPVMSRMLRKQQESHTESWTEDYTDALPPQPPPETRSFVSMGTERTDIHSISEMIDQSHLYPHPHTTYHHHQQTASEFEEVESLPEPPIVVRRPEVTSHMVDDVFLRTITEKKTIEDVEKYKRLVTEYKARPVPDPTWDVTIRQHPTANDQRPPTWEDFSDTSSASALTLTPKMERQTFSLPPQTFIGGSGEKLTSPELVGNMKPIEMPPEDKAVPNWDVLIRVLEQPEEDQPDVQVIPDDNSSVHSSHLLQRQISYDDKVKWRDIITTESTLRTMLTEAVVREDFERIRSDSRYETLFQPRTWDVLIRILAPPDDIELRTPRRNRKKEPWDTRSRRSSLPTLYEYDSDGGSSVRTITHDILPTGGNNAYNYPPHSRRTSRSSFHADNVDMRSMSEVMVDFGRPEHLDNMSETSSSYPNRYVIN